MSRLVLRALLAIIAALSLSEPLVAPDLHTVSARAGSALPDAKGAVCLPPALTSRAGVAPSPEEPRTHVPGAVLIRMKTGLGAAQATNAAETVGGSIHCGFTDWDVYLVQVQPGAEEDALVHLRAHPDVASAQVDRVLRLHATPNDTRFAQQWALAKINAPAAWDISTGSESVIVANVDSGVDLTHPDLQGKITMPVNIMDNTATAMDDFGHGTHVAGIAVAATNNQAGIAGIAQRARLMPVKVVDNKGESTETVLANGIKYAVDNGAKIINLSLGGPDEDIVVQEAINYAYSKGALIVASAGNCFSDGAECGGKINPPIYPAAYPNVLAVGGTGSQDEHASYSETGEYVDLTAPGGSPPGTIDTALGILSTALRSKNQSGYEVQSGTSQAAPHVSGLAALVWSVAPSLTNDQVAHLLMATAADLGTPGKDPVFGAGRINALAALQAAQNLTQAPNPGGPANGSTLQGMTTTLAWTNPSNTTQYQIQVTPANNDGPAVNLIRNVETAFTLQAPVLGTGPYVLLPGMSYSWRVRATAKPTFAPEDDPLWGPWSQPRTFRTPAPSTEGLRPVSPAAGATVGNTGPQSLRWDHPSTSLFYWEVQVSGDTRFDPDPATATSFVWWNLVHGGVTNPLNSWTTPALEPKTTYFWRVRPRVQGDGEGVAWGPAWSFTTP